MKYTRHELELLGAALYLGEGTKARKTKKGTVYAIEFTNTEARMIEIFMLFLRNVILPVEDRIKAQLFMYCDHNEMELKEFWSKKLNIPLSRFQKTILLKQGSGRYRPSQYGITKIRYCHKIHFLALQCIIDKVFGGVA